MLEENLRVLETAQLEKGANVGVPRLPWPSGEAWILAGRNLRRGMDPQQKNL